jgi:hypothetical protein
MSTKKYRPYLTLAQLKHIEQCMLAVKQQSQVDQETITYLHHFIYEIEKDMRKPNHTLKPSLTQRLGFEPEEPVKFEDEESKLFSKEDHST